MLSTMTTPATTRIVPLGPEHRDEVLRVDQAAFAFDPDEADPAVETVFFEWDRTFGAIRPAAGRRREVPNAAWDEDEELAGLNTVYSLTLTVPGRGGETRAVPMAALSWVSVHPDHRRRGVLTAMMRHHLHGLHEQGGEPLAGLFSAEPVIYPRYGYGEASPCVRVTLPQGSTLRPIPDRTEVSISMIDADSAESLAVVDELFAVAAPTRVGRLTRPTVATRHFLRDQPEQRRGIEPSRLLVARRDGEVTGYAVLQRTLGWKDGAPDGKVEVQELTGLDAPTLHALWTRVLTIDLMREVTIPMIGLEDPLLAWLEDLRAVTARRQDALWLRLVDVDRALSARGYDDDVDVTFALDDPFCPWNAGTWRLSVSGEQVSCERSDDAEPDIALNVQELATAYLGGHSLVGLAAAGLVRENRPGAVLALSRALRGGMEPAVPQMF
jgi:predicted acetyltransferase